MINFTIMNILITSAGRRVSLIKAFKESSLKLKTKSKIFITDINTERSPAAYFADGSFNIGYFNDPNYINDLLKISLTINKFINQKVISSIW